VSWSESTRFSVVIDRVSRSVQKRAIHPEDVLRLATEAAALKVLSGVPGVVPLLSWDGQTLITQYIEGRPLLVAWKDWDVPTRRHIAISLLKSVAAIHARGVAHRDLSPDNILITADNQLFLIDFELARLKGHCLLYTSPSPRDIP
jgi:serine/threonine protein kinase